MGIAESLTGDNGDSVPCPYAEGDPLSAFGGVFVCTRRAGHDAGHHVMRITEAAYLERRARAGQRGQANTSSGPGTRET